MVTTTGILRFLQNSHMTPQSITFFCLCGRGCFGPRSWLSMSISEHLPPTPTTRAGGHRKTQLTKNTVTFFPLVSEYPETSMKRNKKKGGGVKKVGAVVKSVLYLVLVEIRLLHFSQGVFQVAEHKLLNLVVVCGPHFLDSHTNTDSIGAWKWNKSAMNYVSNGPETLPFETPGGSPWSRRGRSSVLVCQWTWQKKWWFTSVNTHIGDAAERFTVHECVLSFDLPL